VVLASTAGSVLHFQNFDQEPLHAISNLFNTTLDAVSNASSQLIPPAGAATWDVESFDEFTTTEYFTIVFLGLGSSSQTSSDVKLPTNTKNVGSIRVGPTAIAPLYDIDLDNGFGVDNAQLDIARCAFAYFLDVAMRNRWHLVMPKAKYYTAEIEKALGHPFRRYRDYIRQIFIWYQYPDGKMVYPEYWDVARLFLQDYDEIYSGPTVVGQYHKAPAVYEDMAEKWLAFDNLAQHLVEAVDPPLEHGGETAPYVV